MRITLVRATSQWNRRFVYWGTVQRRRWAAIQTCVSEVRPQRVRKSLIDHLRVQMSPRRCNTGAYGYKDTLGQDARELQPEHTPRDVTLNVCQLLHPVDSPTEARNPTPD